MKKKIVVFAGNECLKEKEEYYYSLAYETGKLLAENNFITVTGGGPGLMDRVMKGAFENGGETYAVRLNLTGRKHSEYVTNFISFDDLNKRQDELLKMADGIISLPGGVGTFYEVFAVLALKRKGEYDKNKPLILVGDYFSEFEKLMGKMFKEGFAQKDLKSFYTKVSFCEEAIKNLRNILNNI